MHFAVKCRSTQHSCVESTTASFRFGTKQIYKFVMEDGGSSLVPCCCSSMDRQDQTIDKRQRVVPLPRIQAKGSSPAPGLSFPI